MAQAGAIETQPEGIAQGIVAEQHQLGAVAAGHFAAVHQNTEVHQTRIPEFAEFVPHRWRRQAARSPQQPAAKRGRRRSVRIGHKSRLTHSTPDSLMMFPPPARPRCEARYQSPCTRRAKRPILGRDNGYEDLDFWLLSASGGGG